jgi:carbon-monoxide dehydrogenase large subunit
MSVRRREDSRFLTGGGSFVANSNLDQQAYAKVVRSPHGHAYIKNINIEEAIKLDGVVAVLTGADLETDLIGPLPCTTQFPAILPIVSTKRLALAVGRVRHVGDPVVFVVAKSNEIACAAVELIQIEYDPIPPVVEVMDALRPGSQSIWETAPDNIAYRFAKGEKEEVKKAITDAHYVAELEIKNNRVMAAPLEPRAGLSFYDAKTDTMHLSCTAQGVHAIRDQLAYDVFKVPPEKIRVSAPDIGGGFGLKNFLFPEWVLLLWASKKLGRPIKWVAERSEDNSSALHGRDITTDAKLALDKDGNFLALEADLTANMGAYLSAGGPNASTNAASTAMGGVYNIPCVFMSSKGVFTNTTPVDAYRGAGKPEANFIIERLIDIAASQFNFDPVELRLKNIISTLPHNTAFGLQIDSGKFKENIERASNYIDYKGFFKRREASRERGFLRGIGFGCFLETSRGSPVEGAEIRFAESGRIELRVGTESNGQGHETTYIDLVSERLGVEADLFDYIQANTFEVRLGSGHGGARSMHMGAATMILAVEEVIGKAKGVAAVLLQAEIDELSFKNGSFTSGSGNRSVTLKEVAIAARDNRIAPHLEGMGLDTFTKRENAPFTFPNGCHAAEVEIDPETGAVTLMRYIMVDDYGSLVNPVLTEGQLHGGVAQGIGQALMEFVSFDENTGQLLSGSLMDYTLPRAAMLPNFEATLEGAPTKANVLGVKGVGQAGCIAAPQTIVHAVLNALSPLKIIHLDMPLTSQSIWRAISASQA